MCCYPCFHQVDEKLKDRQAVKAIAIRMDRAILGKLGDIKPVGKGISEMRIFVGKGYRVYFVIRNNSLLILPCGGDNSSQYELNNDLVA